MSEELKIESIQTDDHEIKAVGEYINGSIITRIIKSDKYPKQCSLICEDGSTITFCNVARVDTEVRVALNQDAIKSVDELDSLLRLAPYYTGDKLVLALRVIGGYFKFPKRVAFKDGLQLCGAHDLVAAGITEESAIALASCGCYLEGGWVIINI